VARFTAFYDANVLYPSDLRNLPMHLALTGLFRATWSAGVHEEWMSALLRNRTDLSREKLERTRRLMDRHATDALVTGYEDLIPGLHLPDPNDRHVLAAAIRGRADVIVTANLRDFLRRLLGVRDRGATPGRIRVAPSGSRAGYGMGGRSESSREPEESTESN
jgi:predicted nucleic acid-binding protein